MWPAINRYYQVIYLVLEFGPVFLSELQRPWLDKLSCTDNHMSSIAHLDTGPAKCCPISSGMEFVPKANTWIAIFNQSIWKACQSKQCNTSPDFQILVQYHSLVGWSDVLSIYINTWHGSSEIILIICTKSTSIPWIDNADSKICILSFFHPSNLSFIAIIILFS